MLRCKCLSLYIRHSILLPKYGEHVSHRILASSVRCRKQTIGVAKHANVSTVSLRPNRRHCSKRQSLFVPHMRRHTNSESHGTAISLMLLHTQVRHPTKPSMNQRLQASLWHFAPILPRNRVQVSIHMPSTQDKRLLQHRASPTSPLNVVPVHRRPTRSCASNYHDLTDPTSLPMVLIDRVPANMALDRIGFLHSKNMWPLSIRTIAVRNV